MSTEKETVKPSFMALFETRIAIWFLAVVLGIYVVLVLAQIAVAAGWLQAGPIETLFDSYKSIMFPLLTLVIGHYFGSRSKQSASSNSASTPAEKI